MDVLTDVLQTVRARAACSGRIEAGAPWGIEFEEGEDARFHVVLEGRLWLRTGDSEVLELERGDLVAIPHGDAHALVDAPTSPTRPIGEVLGQRRERAAVGVGGDGQRASFWSGRIEFEDRRGNPLLSVLPRVMVLRGELARSVHWLEPTLAILSCESASERPGAQTVVSRLADVIFIQIVRGHLATLGREGTGWLAALADAQVGAALSLVHQSPEQNWTVQELAQRVAMSRSAFAARFTRMVGEPPLHYVTRWRMQKAASLLRDGQSTIAQIAEAVGYDSEAAFSKAFKRALGAAPGAYRRAARPRFLDAA
ncbi:MAG TPA: AraC family transcriptional regulator [Polyangiaceae bacterium]|jgi:AraC-like DNA-binding protein|nr:AraC family transcriptional regulator [Polyangiaceae bacterium]